MWCGVRRSAWWPHVLSFAINLYIAAHAHRIAGEKLILKPTFIDMLHAR